MIPETVDGMDVSMRSRMSGWYPRRSNVPLKRPSSCERLLTTANAPDSCPMVEQSDEGNSQSHFVDVRVTRNGIWVAGVS